LRAILGKTARNLVYAPRLAALLPSESAGASAGAAEAKGDRHAHTLRYPSIMLPGGGGQNKVVARMDTI